MFSDLTGGSRRNRNQKSWVLMSTRATCWFRETQTNLKLMQADCQTSDRRLRINQTRHQNNEEPADSLDCEPTAAMKKFLDRSWQDSSNRSTKDNPTAKGINPIIMGPTEPICEQGRLERGRGKASDHNSPSPMEHIGTHVRNSNKTTKTNTTSASVGRIKFRSQAPKWFERGAWLTATLCALLLVGNMTPVATGQEVSKSEAEQQQAQASEQVVGASGERATSGGVANEETTQQKMPLDETQLSADAHPLESSSMSNGPAASVDAASTNQQTDSIDFKQAVSEKRPETASGAELEMAAALSIGQQQQPQAQPISFNSSEQADQQRQIQVQSDESVGLPAVPQDVQDGEQGGDSGDQQQAQPSAAQQQQQSRQNEEDKQARVANQSSEQSQRWANFDNNLPPVASQFAGSGESRFGAKHAPAKQTDQTEQTTNPKTVRPLKRAQGGHASVFGRKRTSQADVSQAASKAGNSIRRPESAARHPNERTTQQQQQQHHHHHYYYQTLHQNQAGARQGRTGANLKQADFPDYKEILVQPENEGANQYEAQRRPAEAQQSRGASSEQQNPTEPTTTTDTSGGSSQDQFGQQQQEQQPEKVTTTTEQAAATTTTTPPAPYIRLSNIATINSNTAGSANSSSAGGGGQPGEMKLMRIYVIDLDQKLVVGPSAYSSSETSSEQKSNGTTGQTSQSAPPMDSSESAHIEQTKVEIGESNADEPSAQHPYNEQPAHMLQTQQSAHVYTTTTTSVAPNGAPEPAAVIEQYHKQQHPQQYPQQTSIDANSVRLNPAEFVLVDRDSLQSNLSQLVAAMGQTNGAPSSGYHYRHYLQPAAGGDNHWQRNYEPSQANGHLANNGTGTSTATTTTTTTTYNTNSGNQYLGPFNKQQEHYRQSQAQLNLGPENSARATGQSSSNQLAADNGNQTLVSVAYPQLMPATAQSQFAAVYPAPKQHHQHHHHQLQLQQPVPQYTAPQYNGAGGNSSAPQSVLYDKQQVSVDHGQYSTSVAGRQLGQYDEPSANYSARAHSPALNPAESSTGQQQPPQQQQPQLDKYQAPARGANMTSNLYAAQPPDSMYQQQQQQQQHPISALTQVYDAQSAEPGQRQHNEPIQKSPAELGPYNQAHAKVTTEPLSLHHSNHWKPVDFASPVVVASVSSGGAPPQSPTQVNFYAQKSAVTRLNGPPADHDIVSLNTRHHNYSATNPSDRAPSQNGSAVTDGQHASSGAPFAGYVNIEQQQPQQQQYHSRPSGEFVPSQQMHAHPSSSLSLALVGYSKQPLNGTSTGLTPTSVTNEYSGGLGGRYPRFNATSQAQAEPNQSEEAPKIPRVRSFATTGSYRQPGGESSSPYAFQEAVNPSESSDSESGNSPLGAYGDSPDSAANEYAHKFNGSSKPLKGRSQRAKGRPKKPASGSLEVGQFGTSEGIEQSGAGNSHQSQQQQLTAGAELSGSEFSRQPGRDQYQQDGSSNPYPQQPLRAYGKPMRPNFNNQQPYTGQLRPSFGVAAKSLLSWQTISSVASGAAKRIPSALSSILSPFSVGSALIQQPISSHVYPTAQSAGYQPQLVPNLPSNYAKQTGPNAHLASIYKQPPYPFRHMNPPESYSDSGTRHTSGHINHVDPQELAEGSGEAHDSGAETTSDEGGGHETDEVHESANQGHESGSSGGNGSMITVAVGPIEQEIGHEAANSSAKGQVITDLAEISPDGKPLKMTKPRDTKIKVGSKAQHGGAKTASKPLKLANGAELEAAQVAVLSSIEQELEQHDPSQKHTKRKPAKKMRQASRPNHASLAGNFGLGADINLKPYQTNEPLSQMGAGGGDAQQLADALRGGNAPAMTGLQIGQYKIVPQTQFVQSIIEPSRQMLGQYFKQYIGQLSQLG